MNNGVPPDRPAVASPDLIQGRRSDHMLAELLALNEEMISQLRMERKDTEGTADFITGMIEQHERAASRLRAQLRSLQAAPSTERPVTC